MIRHLPDYRATRIDKMDFLGLLGISMALKLIVEPILSRFGFRKVLVSNAILIGVLIILFATINVGISIWQILLLACAFGFFHRES